ncbi:MAG: sulfatase-like hydrolase/transferase [Congregibacter sp.]|nr:sulfatase-like hydrolase/transferase [Congregibacter sp.]
MRIWKVSAQPLLRRASLLSLVLLSQLSDSFLALAQAQETRPNIIFLLTDDQRADTLSIAGNNEITTPNIDWLAENGIRYNSAFTVAPICAPSRFAFLSGQYERISGLGFNSPYQVSEAQWVQTYPALLREAGYFTGFIGKFGVQYYSLKSSANAKFDYWRAHDGWLPFFPKDLPSNPATLAYKDAKAEITTEIMGEFVQDFLGKLPKDKPFNLSVSFSAPHNSVVSSMYTDGADPDCTHYACRVMGYPANNNPKLRGHPFYDELYRNPPRSIAADTGLSSDPFIDKDIIDHAARQKWYAYNYDPVLQREHQVRYYQAISSIDNVVGKLVQRLQTLGLADNTIIIFSSDHGLLNGEYGTGGKALLYDLVAKIPLIIFDPRAPRAQRSVVKDDLVLSIDIPASILAYANVRQPGAMQGRDLNTGVSPRTEVFLESLTVAEGNPFIEALRTREWKYVRYLKANGCPYTEAQLDFTHQRPIFEQLFHLTDDPLERRNLASEPVHADRLSDFRKRTQLQSIEMTQEGRSYKKQLPVPLRPVEGAYCW